MSEISVCIITKNEEQNLSKCLDAIAAYPFEIVVVDTGSTDNSREVALAHGAKVYDFPWINDFSAARNFSIAKASHNWILVLDSDEYVQNLDYDALLTFMQTSPKTIGRIERHSSDVDNNTTIDQVERFFDRRIYHYERPIHEQVLPILKDHIELASVPVLVDHSGYFTPEIAKQKSDRNIELLESYLIDHPDDIYTYFQIGQSYYMIKEFEKALPYFEKALSYDLVPEAEYVQMLVVSYGHCLIYLGQIDTCIAFMEQIYEFFENYGDFVFLHACNYVRTKQYLKAIPLFVRCLNLRDFKSEGVTTYLPLYNLGLLYETLGETEMALNFYEKSAPFYPKAAIELEALRAKLS